MITEPFMASAYPDAAMTPSAGLRFPSPCDWASLTITSINPDEPEREMMMKTVLITGVATALLSVASFAHAQPVQAGRPAYVPVQVSPAAQSAGNVDIGQARAINDLKAAVAALQSQVGALRAEVNGLQNQLVVAQAKFNTHEHKATTSSALAMKYECTPQPGGYPSCKQVSAYPTAVLTGVSIGAPK